MASKSLVLVVNPGSASRKYALFADGIKRANVHFEFEDGRIIGSIECDEQKQLKIYEDTDLSIVSRYVMPLLHEYKIINDDENITTIGIRLVAPSMRFTQDELVADDVEAALELLQQKAPLHITTVLSEIKHLKDFFPNIPIIAVSDTAFHVTKRECAWYYGIDTKFADESGIKRYGYHGVSVGSVVHCLEDQSRLSPKTIICHIGSGSSVTAVQNGKSVDTTMGYSPLEGLVMSSRSGTMDVSAALAIKRELRLDDDGLEQYLNKKSGLLGISGSSNDIRQLIISEEAGDKRAKLALDIFVYRLQLAIGQMAASMNGVDCLVFTATVGERSSIIRGRILDGLSYLGFNYDVKANESTFEPTESTNISLKASKTILVISTDESSEIARRAEQFIIQ